MNAGLVKIWKEDQTNRKLYRMGRELARMFPESSRPNTAAEVARLMGFKSRQAADQFALRALGKVGWKLCQQMGEAA